jgi:hypothetical protein
MKIHAVLHELSEREAIATDGGLYDGDAIPPLVPPPPIIPPMAP